MKTEKRDIIVYKVQLHILLRINNGAHEQMGCGGKAPPILYIDNRRICADVDDKCVGVWMDPRDGLD